MIENGKIASKLSPLAICAKCLAMIRWLAGVCVVFFANNFWYGRSVCDCCVARLLCVCV